MLMASDIPKPELMMQVKSELRVPLRWAPILSLVQAVYCHPRLELREVFAHLEKN